MRNLLLKTGVAMAIALVALSAAVPANAQTKMMRVNVPFAFLAGEQMHPAGLYFLQVDQQFGFVNVRNADQRSAVRVLLNPATVERAKGQPAENGFLVFAQYGETWTLRSVWTYGSEGYRVKPSKAEIELAKAFPGGGSIEKSLPAAR